MATEWVEHATTSAPPAPARLLDVLARAQRVVGRSLQAELEREEGVTLEQWRTLRLLSVDRGRTMGELGEALQMPAASLTRTVDGLVDNALVYRRASPEDRRRIEVFPTESGATLLPRLEGLVHAHEARLERASSVAIGDLVTSLEHLIEAE